MPQYAHLHNHTQFSLLDGASDIKKMMQKAKADGQVATALTDHGNMFGVFKFVKEANAAGVKPIVGCEFYMVEDRHKKTFMRSKNERDVRHHQLLLAKNKKGYENLCKLCSIGFMEGLYSKFPRIDKEVLGQYTEGIIATSCCLGAEIPQALLKGKDEEAEEKLKWWLDRFGPDFYIELQRHRGLEDIDGTGVSQEDINQKLIALARKYNVKLIATNDSHYLEEDDATPHDMLLCINTGTIIAEEKRFKFPSSDFYFKTQEEMSELFSDVPEAVANTMEIVDKIEPIELARDVLLPNFPLPEGFTNQDEFLRHLTYVGAKKRYGDIDVHISERLDFELDVIRNSGYPGYFLIVQDFTSTAREMGVSVGPGRGSAAGSAVAYCLGITNIDPIKYDLLFERFLNPERVSLPDIDIDFDDVGRARVIDYVIEKYGRKQVAQIITYGGMKAKMSLRDIGRVMDVPLPEVDRVTKKFPAHLGASLNDVLADKDVAPKLKNSMNKEDLEKAYDFRKLAQAKDQVGKMIQAAKKIEGSIRNTGIHACGVIITPDDITNYVPVSLAKDSDFLVSQFDNSVAEEAGLLKMDFLGLKTLTIIKDAVDIIKTNYGKEIDIDEVDLEDQKTYELFQRGDTIGIFQYESAGMQKHLKDLKPNKFEDLIAMNALYRPGPLQYIPNFVARKHGREAISYDLPDMEEYLAETYGITVYQEQVMLLSQKLAGFSKGQADMLRKGMGKKKKKIIDELWPKFLEGCEANNHPKEIIEKIWKDWEAFASYAFNKSHSTCYAFIAFQTAYLKAHYPAAFMASVLNHNKSDVTKLNFFLRECKRMRIKVLGPDINESFGGFAINKDDAIRFGLSGLKGVGEGPVEEIVNQRDEQGAFTSIFDLVKRVNLRTVNKRAVESLVLGGAFDVFGLTRSQYFEPSKNFDTFLDHCLKYGNSFQNQSSQMTSSLFGDKVMDMIQDPDIPNAEPWHLNYKLDKEKEVTGIYISGHPLDDYRIEIENYTNITLDRVVEINDKALKIGGLVTMVHHGVSKNGNGYGRFTLQDYYGAHDFTLFREDYEKYKSLITKGKVLYIEGMNRKSRYNDNYFFNISRLKLLESVGQDMTKSITIKLPVEQIDEDMITKLEEVFAKHKGNHTFKIKIISDDEAIPDLDMFSEKYRVKANTELLEYFEALGVSYRIN